MAETRRRPVRRLAALALVAAAGAIPLAAALAGHVPWAAVIPGALGLLLWYPLDCLLLTLTDTLKRTDHDPP